MKLGSTSVVCVTKNWVKKYNFMCQVLQWGWLLLSLERLVAKSNFETLLEAG